MATRTEPNPPTTGEKFDLAALACQRIAAWLAEDPPPKRLSARAKAKARKAALTADAPSVWPMGSGDGDAIGQFFNPGPFPADGAARIFIIANDVGRDMALTAARIWVGVSLGGVADCHGQLTRMDGSTLHVLQADHYSQGPSGAACEWAYFTACPFLLRATWKIALTYFANAFGAKGVQGHFTLEVHGYFLD